MVAICIVIATVWMCSTIPSFFLKIRKNRNPNNKGENLKPERMGKFNGSQKS